MCDHRDELVETRALHALGDLVLIRGLRRDPAFVGNVADVILRKCRQKSSKIFAEKKVSEQETIFSFILLDSCKLFS